MKMKSLVVSLFVVSMAASSGAGAWGIPKMDGPLGGASKSSSTASPKQVARDAQNALYRFVKAEMGLAAAFGGYEALAANQQLLEGMKQGDITSTKEDVDQLIKLHKSASEAIGKKIADNAKLDAAQKEQAGKATLDYVRGLLETKKLVGSLKDLTKNPAAIGLDAAPLVALGKDLPGVVSGGISTTNALIKYMTSNGVDVSSVKEAADSLGT